DLELDFPIGTILKPDSYLVVAKDVLLMQTNYPGLQVLGPFQKSLGHKGGSLRLLDAAGNPANEVHYHSFKPWPSTAAGGGSSLELRDPWADNTRPEAWAASLESDRAGWNNYSYRAVAANVLGPTTWKEFVAGLLEEGECLIDDLKVVDSPLGTAV